MNNNFKKDDRLNILLIGGTGFIGTHLTRLLVKHNYFIYKVFRKTKYENTTHITYVDWNLSDQELEKIIEKVDAIINLAGKSVVGYWTNKFKKKMVDSRILTTKRIVSLINKVKKENQIFLNASAIGFFDGFDKQQVCSESDSHGHTFMATLCKNWEKEAQNASCRSAQLRFGLVLGKDKGLLPLVKLPFYFHLGGHLGDGKQWMPWIHIDDACAIILQILKYNIEGPIHLVSPGACQASEFFKLLAKQMNSRSWFHIPEWMITSFGGEFGKSIINTPNVCSIKIKNLDYKFLFPKLELCLDDLA